MRRLLALLIRLYPPAYRREFGQAIEEGLDSALEIGSRGRWGHFGAWVGAAADLIRGGSAAWRDVLGRGLGPHQGKGRGMGWGDKAGLALRFAVRRIRKAPRFSGIVVVILALGIGANAAVFSLVDGVLLRPLPYDDPEDLVFIWSDLTSEGVPRAWVNGNHAHEMAVSLTTFSDIVPMDLSDATLTSGAGREALDVTVGLMGSNFFTTLGVEPRLGRGLLPGEQGSGTALVAVLTDGLWQSAFGGDPDVVGSTVHLDGEAYRVVGVMDPTFRFHIQQSLGRPTPPALFVPFDEDLAGMSASDWGFSIAVMGRIAPGVPHERALAELDQVASRLGDRDFAMPEFRFAVGYLAGDLVAGARPLILLLMAGVGVVLAIVCANVATLFLARAVARQRDARVQMALGAGRGRLVAGTAAETLILAVTGAVLGLALAHVLVQALTGAVPTELPRIDQVTLDLRVGLVTLLAAAGVGVLTAVAPALLHRDETADVLRASSATSGRRSGVSRMQKMLVGSQVALCVTLLISVALIGRSMTRLLEVDAGFRPGEQIRLTVQPGGPDSSGEEILAFYGVLTERLEALPGVRTVGRVSGLPLSTRTNQHHVDLTAAPGATGDEDLDQPLVDRMVADVGYLEAAGLELTEGRWFTSGDLVSDARVVVIDQNLAERFWPTGSPVGQRIGTPRDTIGFQVVGVVRQSRLYSLAADDRPQWWVPHAFATYRRMSMVVDPLPGNHDLSGQIRQAVQAVDPSVAVSELGTMSGLVADALARWRFTVQIMGAFGLVALLLAVLGVYGVTAYAVERRTGELGVRMALGAHPGTIERMVLGQGLRLITWGLVVGVLGAWASGRILGSLLYGVSPTDPVSAFLALTVLLLAGLVAALFPARRASRIHPSEAFRAE